MCKKEEVQDAEFLPHQQRVVDEKKELDSKLKGLGSFFESGTFESISKDEQARLRIQYHVMTAYSEILDIRIKNF